MAKKKPNVPTTTETNEEEQQHQDSLQNLKTLNSMLIKQAMEKRHQIESLVQSKGELESELARYSSQETELRDENFSLSFEMGLVMEVVSDRFKEVGLLVSEKDDKIRVLEDKGADFESLVELLKSESDVFVEDRKVREELLDVVKKEKIVLESVKVAQRKEIEEMEMKLEKVGETVKSLSKEEKVLQGLVVKLERNLDESMVKERLVTEQIDALVREKMVRDGELERVKEEKGLVERQMEMAYVHSSDKEKVIDELSQEKVELEERVVSQEVKIVELGEKVDELTRFVAVLQKDCNGRGKTNEELNCQIGELSYMLEKVKVEREEAGKALDVEKSKGEVLKAEVLGSEKMMETTVKELENVKIERESFLTAKNDLESQSELLKSEKAMLEKELVEVKKAMDALKTELDSVRMVSTQSLVMLKTAASIMSQSDSQEDSVSGAQQERETGTESYTLELEAIEKAFKNKEYIIEEMKKEAVTMKQSEEEAHKNKSFWTLVSSVTTIFAAASFAYAARTR